MRYIIFLVIFMQLNVCFRKLTLQRIVIVTKKAYEKLRKTRNHSL